MSNFPKLIPAFTAHLTCQPVVIDRPEPVGSVSRGTYLTAVPFSTVDSFVRSEPNYPIQIDAVFIHGCDFIRLDPSSKISRLDVTSILKDKSGAVISFKYSGLLSMTPGIRAAMQGSPDAKTTDFGNAFTHVLLETGSPELMELEEKIYVASGRMIVEEGKSTVVEYLISEVAAGS